MSVDAFLTGAFREGTKQINASADRERAKKERERKVKVMAMAAEAFQEYQKTGKPVDPALAAEAQAYGYALPAGALRGFDPSVLEGGPTTGPVGTRIRQPGDTEPGGIVQRTAPPGGEVDPNSPYGRFESGELDFQKAGAESADVRRQKVLDQRAIENRTESVRVIAQYSHIPAKSLAPHQVIQLYNAYMNDDQKTEAAKLLTERRAIIRGSGGKPVVDPDSAAWKAIEAKNARGNNDMSDYEPDEKTLIINMFKDSDDRADFLGSGKGAKNIWKEGSSAIRAWRNKIWTSDIMAVMALEAWMNDDPDWKFNLAQIRYFKKTTDKRTGATFPRVILEYGAERIKEREQWLKDQDVSTAVSDYVEAFVSEYTRQFYDLPPGGVPQVPNWRDVEEELRSEGITYDIGKMKDMFDRRVAEEEQKMLRPGG